MGIVKKEFHLGRLKFLADELASALVPVVMQLCA